MYRGPMVITVMDRPDLVKVKDLITNRESLVHASRLRPFKHPKDMSAEKIESLVAADLNEFCEEKIIGHIGTGKNPKRWKFRVRWRGYEPEDDTMLDWAAVKNLAALDDYSKVNQHFGLCSTIILWSLCWLKLLAPAYLPRRFGGFSSLLPIVINSF